MGVPRLLERIRKASLPVAAAFFATLIWAPSGLSATGDLELVDCLTADSDVGSKNGCVQTAVNAPEADNTGLRGMRSPTVSPDGTSVYVLGYSDASILTFSRNTNTGRLTLEACLTADSKVGTKNGCVQTASSAPNGGDTGFSFPEDAEISADGRHLYVVTAQDSSVLRFTRDTTTGALTYNDCFSADSDVGTNNACVQAATATSGGADTGFDRLQGIALSPDGHSLYTTARDDAAVARFTRDTTTGELTYEDCFTADSGVGIVNDCTPAAMTAAGGDDTGFKAIQDVVVSPNGTSIYGVASGDSALFRMNRNPSSGVIAQNDCISSDSDVGTSNGCTQLSDNASEGSNTGFDDPFDFALSPDGASIYTTNYDDAGVTRFSRNATTGAISYEGCFTADANVGTKNNCTPAPQSAAGGSNTGFAASWGITVSPDGQSVYGATESDASLFQFTRNPATGALTYESCLTSDLGVGTNNNCTQTDDSFAGGADTGLDQLESLVVSPDGKTLYADSGADSSLLTFDREPVPDTTAPNLRISGRKKQRFKRKLELKATVDEEATVRLAQKGKKVVVKRRGNASVAASKKIKFGAKVKKLAADQSKRFNLKPRGQRNRRKLKRLLRKKGRKVVVRLKGTATDEAGNKGKDGFRVKLR
jgi:6-phosphogluconolactonase (cycloisomerase 2 family)